LVFLVVGSAWVLLGGLEVVLAWTTGDAHSSLLPLWLLGFCHLAARLYQDLKPLGLIPGPM
jgi:hypothetical protein